MAIADEIQALNDTVLEAYNAIEEKGGEIPEAKNTENLADAIGSISGGGGDPIVYNADIISTSATGATEQTLNLSAAGGGMGAAMITNTSWQGTTEGMLLYNKLPSEVADEHGVIHNTFEVNGSELIWETPALFSGEQTARDIRDNVLSPIYPGETVSGSTVTRMFPIEPSFEVDDWELVGACTAYLNNRVGSTPGTLYQLKSWKFLYDGINMDDVYSYNNSYRGAGPTSIRIYFSKVITGFGCYGPMSGMTEGKSSAICYPTASTPASPISTLANVVVSNVMTATGSWTTTSASNLPRASLGVGTDDNMKPQFTLWLHEGEDLATILKELKAAKTFMVRDFHLFENGDIAVANQEDNCFRPSEAQINSWKNANWKEGENILKMKNSPFVSFGGVFRYEYPTKFSDYPTQGTISINNYRTGTQTYIALAKKGQALPSGVIEQW